MNHPGRATGRPAGRERECTPRRSREQIDALVLDLLSQSNRPIGAYDLAGRASAAGEVLVPNQVYRTLHRLIEQGLVHRIESLAAFMLRREPFDTCLICDRCHSVQILSNPDLVAQLTECARLRRFEVSKAVIETHGHCAQCGTPPHPTGDSAPAA